MILVRPLISLDLESSGTDPNKDRIVEIAAIKRNPDGSKEEKVYLINPEIDIPEEASNIHGITNEKVKDAPTFRQIAKAMHKWFEGCDICGFNSDSFDVNLLIAEMSRADVDFLTWEPNFVDVRKVFQAFYPNTLSDIYKRFFQKELENAHSAAADIYATDEILEYMIKEHPEVDLSTPEKIDLFCQGDKGRVDVAGKLYKDADGIVKYNFGDDKGKSVKDNPGLGLWALKKDFPEQTKKIIKQIINGK